jgi:hypothetical protein
MIGRTRVGIVGYGVIGKRVAQAVARQADMVLEGVADVVAAWRIQAAAARGLPLYAADPWIPETIDAITVDRTSQCRRRIDCHDGLRPRNGHPFRNQARGLTTAHACHPVHQEHYP